MSPVWMVPLVQLDSKVCKESRADRDHRDREDQKDPLVYRVLRVQPGELDPQESQVFLELRVTVVS